MSWPQLDGLIAALRTAPARTGSVISTIYGDAVLPRGGAIALSDLLALTARLGASEGVVRTAVSRLAQGGVLHGRRVGRRSAYALTAAAEAEFRAAVPRIYGGPPVHWDGALRLAFPQDAAQRRALEEAGFQTLLPGVVIGLRAPTEGPACVDAAGPPAMLRELAARAWPVQALQDRYAGFIASFGDLVIPGGVDPLDAIAARIVLIHAWRRIVLRDPHLPAALLPPDWPGENARRLCSRLYAALAGPSEAWLDQTTTGPDPLPSGPDPVGRWSPDPA